jgi:hypothetical protein
MYEVDFLAVGDGERSGDAIAMRFTSPGSPAPAVVVIDTGFSDDGDAMVAHVMEHYKTDYVDLVFSTYGDRDHICGLPIVLRELRIGALAVQRPALHGFPDDSASDRAEELVELALGQGAQVAEPVAGMTAFDGALVVGGPTEGFYEEMLVAENISEGAGVPTLTKRLTGVLSRTARRVLAAFPPRDILRRRGGDERPQQRRSSCRCPRRG